MRDDLREVAGLIRVGKVMAVDNANYLCRVKYEDRGYTSDWLRVLDNRPFIPGYDQPQRTEYSAGGSGDAAYESHMHQLIIEQWMPKVGRDVIVIFPPARNSEGYVLGGI